MTNAQPGILEPIPRFARYLTFSQLPETDPRAALEALAESVDGEELGLGIGQSLALHLGCEIDGLRVFPGHAGAGFEAQLLRMTGAEDGVVDALFSFTRPVSGAYFWCPPLENGRLNLGLLGM